MQRSSTTSRRRRSRGPAQLAAVTALGTRPAPHVLIDGSAAAQRASGRYCAAPLFDALAAARTAYRRSAVTVILDAHVMYRLSDRDRARVDAAILDGSVVLPPAGCVGGTLGFVKAVIGRLELRPVLVSDGRFASLYGKHRHVSSLCEPRAAGRAA